MEFDELDESFFQNKTREQIIEELLHLKRQFRARYQYLVGEWAGTKRAKDTRNGQFVTAEEVQQYLNN